MKTYAFIDVHNTTNSAQQFLGIVIDWRKLFEYLKKDWDCEKVFFYSGIESGDTETANEFESLKALDYAVIRTKPIFAHKRKDKTIQLKCIACKADNVTVIDMGYNKKANCDVELTVDAMELAGPDTQFLIFTGDGDFEYLIRNVVVKGTKVYIVSDPSRFVKAGLPISRFSTKLRDLVRANRGKVDLIPLNNIKLKIKKDIV